MLATSFRRARRTLAAVTACILVGALPAPGRAADRDALRVYSAAVADANDGGAIALSFDPALLTTPNGVSRLRREIGRAARRACAAYLGADSDADPTECRAGAIADALSSLSVITANREALSEVAEAP